MAITLTCITAYIIIIQRLKNKTSGSCVFLTAIAITVLRNEGNFKSMMEFFSPIAVKNIEKVLQ